MTVIHLLTIALALALGFILGYSFGYTDAEQESLDREPEIEPHTFTIHRPRSSAR